MIVALMLEGVSGFDQKKLEREIRADLVSIVMSIWRHGDGYGLSGYGFFARRNH
jgi:hypothetical protein